MGIDDMGDFWDDVEKDEGPDPLDEDYLGAAVNERQVVQEVYDSLGEAKAQVAEAQVPADVGFSVIVYDGLSARFKDGANLNDKLESVTGLTMFVKAGPLLLGDLFNDLYDNHKLDDGEIGGYFDLAEGTVKNMRMWARKIPGENRRPGIETSLAQEAASIKDLQEQAAFIERALEEGLSKAEMRAVKAGDEPEQVDPGEEVEMMKCPTCGTHVKADLIS